MKKAILAILVLALSFGTLPVFGWADEQTEEPVEISVLANLFSDPPDMEGPFWTEWQRMTNSKLNVEWVPSGDYDTKLNLKLASNSLPELTIVTSMSANVQTAIAGGAFWGLSGLLGDMSEYPNIRDNITPDTFKYMSLDGEIWGVPRSRPQIGCGLKIRKDWLDDLGLEIPTTIDEYTDALRAITKADLDGNGVDDTIGYICVGAPSQWYNCLKLPFGYYEPQFTEDGGYLPPFLADNYFDFIEYATTLYSEGLLATEFVALKNQSGMDLFTTGQGASYSRDMWWDYQWEQTMRETDPDAEIANIVITGPKGNNVSLTVGIYGGLFISKNCTEEKAKRILKYIDATATEEVTNFAYYGQEGVHHEVIDGARKLTDLGVKEVTATTPVIAALDYNAEPNKYAKTDSASAPLEYNLAKREQCANYTEIGTVDFFGYLISSTWANEWPKYEEDFRAMESECVVGNISLDDFKAYVLELREDPQMKQAFIELADSYNSLFPEG